MQNPDRLWSALPIGSISARLVLLAPGALNKVLAPLRVHVKGSFLLHLDPHCTSVLLYHLRGGRCEPGKKEEGKVGQGWTGLFSSTHPYLTEAVLSIRDMRRC